jgi:hypothetical protein
MGFRTRSRGASGDSESDGQEERGILTPVASSGRVEGVREGRAGSCGVGGGVCFVAGRAWANHEKMIEEKRRMRRERPR